MAKVKAKVRKEPKKAKEKAERILEEFSSANRVRVGFPENSNNYPDGTSVIMVAMVHEFGSPARGVPERSFIRSTINENRSAYIKASKTLFSKVVKGKIDMDRALGMLGQIVVGDINQKILDIDSPPLKNRDGNPLWDTGHMAQSVTYVIEDASDD